MFLDYCKSYAMDLLFREGHDVTMLIPERGLNTTFAGFEQFHIEASFGKEAGVQRPNLNGEGEKGHFSEL